MKNIKYIRALSVILLIVMVLLTGCGDDSTETPKTTAKATRKTNAATSAQATKTRKASDADIAIIKNAKSVGGLKDGIGYFKTNEGKYGYFAKEGCILVPAIYDKASGFSGGYGKVKLNGKYGLVDKDGNLTVKCIYDSISDMGGIDGLFIVKQDRNDSTYSIIDGKGSKKGDGFLDVFKFSNGLAAAKTETENGYIDKTGKFVIKLPYDWELGDFEDGFALYISEKKAEKTSTIGLIDNKGNVVKSVVVPLTGLKLYSSYYDKSTDILYVSRSLANLSAINMNNGEIKTAQYPFLPKKIKKKSMEVKLGDFRLEFSEGYMPVEIMDSDDYKLNTYFNTWGYILASSQPYLMLYPEKTGWSEAKEFHDGYAIVKTCGFDSMGFLDHGKEGAYGIIHKTGKYVVEPYYTSLSYNGNGLYSGSRKIGNNTYYTILDTRGGKITEDDGQITSTTQNGEYIKLRNKSYSDAWRYKLTDKYLNPIIAGDYSDMQIDSYNMTFVMAKENDIWYCFDSKGKKLW